MRVLERHPFVEEMEARWGGALRAAREAYSGHAYRVLNYARALIGTEQHDDELALAAAFHDLGIWSDRTFDYLGPSQQRAEAFRREGAPGIDAELLALLISDHHLLRRPRTGIEPALRMPFAGPISWTSAAERSGPVCRPPLCERWRIASPTMGSTPSS